MSWRPSRRSRRAPEAGHGRKNLGELETDQLEGKIIAELGSSPRPSPTWWSTSITSARLPASTPSASARDFDGVECVPEGLDDVSKYPNLTRALLEKGYTAEDIRKIYSGNFLRVMRAVEMAAGK